MDDALPTLAEIEAYARRHGLTNLTPDRLQRLAGIAANMARAGQEVPRVASKFTQPANVFRAQRTSGSGRPRP